uniref:Carboxypeptidase n=1 Tax=Phallusia mammillata TaxID=59560 RepID=A0A6F9DAY0_9ASCI|nr:lysosomal protective protein-like [Phallusia mammillata]
MMMLRCLVLISGLACVFAAKADDLVTHLPGASPFPSFKMYSGYLDASETKHFHYWFVESQNDPASDPVVLWLNGGPGCSSLDGFLSENGPLHVKDDGETLSNNPYSWNKIANVIYLESPAGVGYSYDDNGDTKVNDDDVSMLNHNALVDFFKKFPEYASNPFFVTGESYGGIYVPTLSVRIMEGSFKFNFKGMAIGNGLSSFPLNDNSLIFFGYYHGLYGASLWDNLTTHCCVDGMGVQEKCNFHASPNAQCQQGVFEAFNIVYQSGLNEYALYLDCYGGAGTSKLRYLHDMKNLFQKNLLVRKYSTIVERKLTQTLNVQQGKDSTGVVPPCINSTAETNWLNRQDVRSALHIKAHLPEWSVCSNLQYTTIYQNMTAQYHQLLKHPDFHILLYNGDTDMACNFLGDEWFVESLKQPVSRSRKPWYLEGQVAGFAQEYGTLSYTTIRGAGHMVPQWAPTYAFAMFEKFINNKHFV